MSHNDNMHDQPGYQDEVAAFALVASVFLGLVGVICLVNKFRYRQLLRRNDVQIQSDVQLVQDSLRALFREEFARSTRELSARRLIERKEHIANKLQSTTFSTKGDASTVHSGQNVSEEDVEAAQEKEDETCAICLNEYKHGDDITTSCNSACSHHFHRECITEWLLTHEFCPCCRHAYLWNDAAVAEADRTASAEDSPLQRGLLLLSQLTQGPTTSPTALTSADATTTERTEQMTSEDENTREESNAVDVDHEP